MSAKLSIVCFIIFSITSCGGSGGGSKNESASQPNISANKSSASFISSVSSSNSNVSRLGVAGQIDRKKSKWHVSTTTDQITGVKTTYSQTNAFGGSFSIYCSAGSYGYYLHTTEITESGTVSYRIGTADAVKENWSEGSSFKVLVPRARSFEFLKQLYLNSEMFISYDAYLGGSVVVELDLSGFPTTIDETRGECGWSTDLFPTDNGWGKPYPTEAPTNAEESTYTSGNAFRVLAWIETNANGGSQILVRVGDFDGPCEGSALAGTNAFYVSQNGKTVPAVSGNSYKISCKSPEIIALNGEYDANKPLDLEVYSFHYNDLERGTPFTVIHLN